MYSVICIPLHGLTIPILHFISKVWHLTTLHISYVISSALGTLLYLCRYNIYFYVTTINFKLEWICYTIDCRCSSSNWWLAVCMYSVLIKEVSSFY